MRYTKAGGNPSKKLSFLVRAPSAAPVSPQGLAGGGPGHRPGGGPRHRPAPSLLHAGWRAEAAPSIAGNGG